MKTHGLKDLEIFMGSFVLNTKLAFHSKNYHVNLHKIDHNILERWGTSYVINLVEFDVCILNYLERIYSIVP